MAGYERDLGSDDRDWDHCRGVHGNMDAINQAVITNTQEAVVFAIGLTGIMSVWLGLMKVAEKKVRIDSSDRKSGQSDHANFILEVPENHPAMTYHDEYDRQYVWGGKFSNGIGIKAMEQFAGAIPTKNGP